MTSGANVVDQPAGFARLVALGREIASIAPFDLWLGELSSTGGEAHDIEGHWIATSMGEGAVYDPFLVAGRLSADGVAARLAFAIGWSLRRGVSPIHQKAIERMHACLGREMLEEGRDPLSIHPMASEVRGVRLWYASLDQSLVLDGELLRLADACKAGLSRLVSPRDALAVEAV